MLLPRGFHRPLGIFCFIHTFEVPALSFYSVLILTSAEYQRTLRSLLQFRDKLIQQGR